MVKYVTKSGDTFDKVAYEQLGDCKYTGDLLEVNRDKLQTYEFPAGVELNLPEISEVESTKLPNWWGA